MSVRRTTHRPDQPAADAAARRLALIAADLGAPPTGQQAEPWWADHTRVARAEIAAEDRDEVGMAEECAREQAEIPPGAGARGLAGPSAPALPQPGRHAARRARSRTEPRAAISPLTERLPALGMPQIAVVAVAVALGLAVTTWWVLRDRAEPLEPVSAEPVTPFVAATGAGAGTGTGAGAGSAAGPTAGVEPSPSAATVTVDVAGKVRRPGIVVLAAGARVTDALAAAGGARKGVDLTPLNLARVLVDGEQIVVGSPQAGARGSGSGSGAETGSGAGGTGAAGGPLVNLNTAGQAELESLPQVGPVTAQAIIAWRDARGGFTRVEELLEVDGIGEKTLEQITPHVTV